MKHTLALILQCFGGALRSALGTFCFTPYEEFKSVVAKSSHCPFVATCLRRWHLRKQLGGNIRPIVCTEAPNRNLK